MAGYHQYRGVDLSAREREVLALMANGLTNGQIAERLDIAFDTAKSHVSAIISKLGVETREEAVREWKDSQRVGARMSRMTQGMIAGLGLWKVAAAATATVVIGTTAFAGLLLYPPGTKSEPPSIEDIYSVFARPPTDAEEELVAVRSEGDLDFGTVVAVRALGSHAGVRFEVFYTAENKVCFLMETSTPRGSGSSCAALDEIHVRPAPRFSVAQFSAVLIPDGYAAAATQLEGATVVGNNVVFFDAVRYDGREWSQVQLQAADGESDPVPIWVPPS